jgi:hypothetical protein
LDDISFCRADSFYEQKIVKRRSGVKGRRSLAQRPPLTLRRRDMLAYGWRAQVFALASHTGAFRPRPFLAVNHCCDAFYVLV